MRGLVAGLIIPIIVCAWFPVLLFAGDWYGVYIDTANNVGNNAVFAFDYISTNDTTNCIYISSFETDAKIGVLREYGGGHDDYSVLHFGFDDSDIGICDSAGTFYNSFVVEIDSLGTYFGFAVSFDDTAAKAAGKKDEFAFHFLGAHNQFPFQTDDTISNALFAITLNDDESRDLTYYDPMEFIPEAGNDSLKLSLDDVVGIPREPVEERVRILSMYPNPFAQNLTVKYSVPENGTLVEASIFDVQGRLVKRLTQEPLSTGEYSLQWMGNDGNGRRVASGIYFLRFRGPGYSTVRKVFLSR